MWTLSASPGQSVYPSLSFDLLFDLLCTHRYHLMKNPEESKTVEEGADAKCEVCPDQPGPPHVKPLSGTEAKAQLDQASTTKEAFAALFREEACRHTGAYLSASAKFMSTHRERSQGEKQRWVDTWHPLLCCEHRHTNRLVATHTADSLRRQLAADKPLQARIQALISLG